MLDQSYNGNGGKGFLVPAVAEFFSRKIALRKYAGVSVMSLSDGDFNPAAREESDHVSLSRAFGSSPDDIFKDQVAGALSPAAQASPDVNLIDAALDRLRRAPVGADDPARSGAQSKPEADPGVKLQQAWQKAQQYQRDLPKLQAGKMTTAQSAGPDRIHQNNGQKAEVTKDLRAAIREYKDANPAPEAPKGEGKPGLAGEALKLAVDAVIPVMPAVRAVKSALGENGGGSFATFNQAGSDLASRIESDEGYQVSAMAGPTETVDIMQPQAAPDISGASIDQKLSEGPGFSTGEYEHLVKPSLEDTKITFNPRQLEYMEATLQHMEQDVRMTDQMLHRWAETKIIGVPDGVSIEKLKLNETDQALLASGARQLEEEVLRNAAVSPKAPFGLTS